MQHKSYNIQIFNDSGVNPIPRKKIYDTIVHVLVGEAIESALVNIILVTDERLHKMNVEFLNHDFKTDVITFPLDENEFEGEVYISLDRAKAQAGDYKVSLTNELIRLAAHGVLHLAGYDDHSDEDRAKMRQLEDKYIKTKKN
jgi:probable rRNA maturation factor